MVSYKRPEKHFKFILYIVVIVLLNIAGATLFFRMDLTQNKIFSLSDASREVVSTLSEPMTINVFLIYTSIHLLYKVLNLKVYKLYCPL